MLSLLVVRNATRLRWCFQSIINNFTCNDRQCTWNSSCARKVYRSQPPQVQWRLQMAFSDSVPVNCNQNNQLPLRYVIPPQYKYSIQRCTHCEIPSDNILKPFLNLWRLEPGWESSKCKARQDCSLFGVHLWCDISIWVFLCIRATSGLRVLLSKYGVYTKQIAENRTYAGIKCSYDVVMFARFSRCCEIYTADRHAMLLRYLDPFRADFSVGIGII